MWKSFLAWPADQRALIALAATLIAAWLGSRLARRLAAAGIRAVLHDTVSTSSPLVRRSEHEMRLGTDLDAIELGKRARTLGSVIQNVTTALVVGIALLMVLK